MTVRSFVQQWMKGFTILSGILVAEIVLLFIVGAIAGVLMLILMLPEWVFGITLAAVFIIFGPWAIAEL